MKEVQLDLHGVKHCDVPHAVHRFINDHWGRTRLRIITGHSPTMQEIVRKVVQEYNLKNTIDLKGVSVLVFQEK